MNHAPGIVLRRANRIAIGAPAIAFATSLSAIVVFLSGLWPAVAVTRPMNDALRKASSQGATGAVGSGFLVAAQVAVAVILLSGTTAAVTPLGRLLPPTILSAAPPPASQVLLPAETVGLDKIVNTLVSTFDHVDVLALSDAHQHKINSDLRIAVIRHPSFPSKVRFVVVEFANTADQNILDRYIGGDDVPIAELRRVWRNTCCGETWDSPVYLQFLAAIRDVNKHLRPAQWIRVLAGDPPAGTPTTQRDFSAASVLRDQVLGKGKALVIYGGGHLSRRGEIAATVRTSQGREMFVVETHGGTDPDLVQFDHALKSSRRPVLFSVRRSPFSEMRADFLGRGTKALVNGVWTDVNPAQGRTLAQASDADAFVYFGSGADAEISITP